MSAIVIYFRLHESYSEGDIKRKNNFIYSVKREIFKLDFICCYMNLLFRDLIHSKSLRCCTSAML